MSEGGRVTHGDTISFKWFQGSGSRSIAAYDDGTVCTLTNSDSHVPAVCFKIRGGSDTYVKHDGSIGTAGKGALMSEETAFTISATQDQMLFQPTFGIQDQTTPKISEDVMLTLVRGGDGGTHQQVAQSVDADGYVVRRLTPLECERLQGMPDNHTRISWRGKPAEECPDGPRYKAIGNSMSINIMRFLGERLQMVDEALRDEP